MIVIAGLIVGAVTGYMQASRRDGNGFDKTQYAMAYAIIGALLGLFLTIGVDRLT